MPPSILLPLLFLLNLVPLISGWRWDSITTSHDILAPRVGHAATLFTPSGASRPLLLSCGGVDASGVPMASCDQLEPFNSWRVTRDTITLPGLARVDGVVAVLGNFLIVWGGASETSGENASLCEVLTIGSWVPPEPHGLCVEPPPINGTSSGDIYRWGASGVVFKNSLWVYGGAKVLDGVALKDDVTDDENSASLMVLAADPTALGDFLWTIPTLGLTSPSRPSPRHWHGAAILAQRSTSEASIMFIQGGFSFSQNKALDDLWMLTLGDNNGAIESGSGTASGGLIAWILLPGPISGGGANSSLWGHRLVVVGDRLLAIGGAGALGAAGVIERDGRAGANGVWTTPAVTDQAPSGPFRAAATVLYADGDADPQVLVIGGSQATEGAVAEGTLIALVDIDYDTLPESKLLPLILGGAAAGVVLLLGFAYIARWRAMSMPHARQPESGAWGIGGGAGAYYTGFGATEADDSLLGQTRNTTYGAAGSLAKARAAMLGETPPLPIKSSYSSPVKESTSSTSSSRERSRSRTSIRSTIKRKASMGSMKADRGFDADALLVTDIEAIGESGDAVLRF